MSSKYVISKDSIEVRRSPNPNDQDLFQVKVTGEDREQRTFYAEYTRYRWKIIGMKSSKRGDATDSSGSVTDSYLAQCIVDAIHLYQEVPHNQVDEFDAMTWRFYNY